MRLAGGFGSQDFPNKERAIQYLNIGHSFDRICTTIAQWRPPNEGVVQVSCASVTTRQVLHLHQITLENPCYQLLTTRVTREQIQQVHGSAWSLVVGECARNMLRPRVPLFFVQQSRTQIKCVCVHDHLLQLKDQLLDLGLGAKSWPAGLPPSSAPCGGLRLTTGWR